MKIEIYIENENIECMMLHILFALIILQSLGASMRFDIVLIFPSKFLFSFLAEIHSLQFLVLKVAKYVTSAHHL